MQQMGKPRQAIENIQPKQPSSARPLSNILPSNPSAIRPASSVSTQTGGQLQSQVITVCIIFLINREFSFVIVKFYLKLFLLLPQ